jgi:hypothetical protein
MPSTSTTKPMVDADVGNGMDIARSAPRTCWRECALPIGGAGVSGLTKSAANPSAYRIATAHTATRSADIAIVWQGD